MEKHEVVREIIRQAKEFNPKLAVCCPLTTFENEELDIKDPKHYLNKPSVLYLELKVPEIEYVDQLDLDFVTNWKTLSIQIHPLDFTEVPDMTPFYLALLKQI